MEINGVAHIRVNVHRFEECIAFYDQVMPYLGLQVVHRSDQFVYYVGGWTPYAPPKVGRLTALTTARPGRKPVLRTSIG